MPTDVGVLITTGYLTQKLTYKSRRPTTSQCPCCTFCNIHHPTSFSPRRTRVSCLRNLWPSTGVFASIQLWCFANAEPSSFSVSFACDLTVMTRNSGMYTDGPLLQASILPRFSRNRCKNVSSHPSAAAYLALHRISTLRFRCRQNAGSLGRMQMLIAV